MSGPVLPLAAVALALGIGAAPLLAQDGPCAASPKQALRQMEAGGMQDACLAEVAGWSLRLHEGIGRQGFLTSGSMLNLFHLPRPDEAVRAGRVLGVALLPVATDLWKVAFVDDGAISEETGHDYYVWAPGDNTVSPDQQGLDWASDEPRFLRCLPYQGLRCVTYYTVEACPERHSAPSFLLSAHREIGTEDLRIFDGFARADAMARDLAERIRVVRCEVLDR